MPEVIISGSEGKLEGRYFHNKEEKSPVVLVLHPHPLHGGTMNNKITYNLFKAFVDNGFSALRINFRGVGKSVGKFDNGIGELTDGTVAMDWLQSQNPKAGIYWVAGFSFGAWVSMQLLMRRPEIMGFIAVAPPVNKYDFSFMSPCSASGLVVQGTEDTISLETHTNGLVNKLNSCKDINVDYNIIEGADHFFRNKIDELYANFDSYIKGRLDLDKEIVSKRKTGKRKRKSRKTKLKII